MPAAEPEPASAGFSPLALQPGWVLERYLGWRVRLEEPGLKLLSKPRWPLVSHLLLADGRARHRLSALIASERLLGPRCLTWICDLSPDAGGDSGWPRERWAPLAEGRWFGVGTFVIDLHAPEEQLLARIASRERSKLRQAQRSGLRTDSTASPGPAELAEFAALYGQMARERGLERPTTDLLTRMSADGVLLLISGRSPDGQLLVANLAYVAHAQGYFLYGARAPEAPAGAGVLAQWGLIRALKAAGLRFYDLGLVASTSEEDGRFRFKRALGGTYVPFGQEYRHVPAWLRAPYRAFQAARQRFARQVSRRRGPDV